MVNPLRVAEGVEIAWRRTGDGPPLVAVHGSWDDRRNWDRVVSPLADAAEVITYDRRGHGESTAPPGQGSIREDAADLLAVVDELAGGAAYLVGHSYGASVVLLAAALRPDAVRGLLVHEPPLYALLSGDEEGERLRAEAAAAMRRAAEAVEAGDPETGAHTFVEHVGFGPGSWTGLFDAEQRATMIGNADTWLDQYRDPDRLAVDVGALAGLAAPITLTLGGATLPIHRLTVRAIAERLPAARVVTLPGAGHAPQLSHPEEFAAAVREHIRG